MPAFMICRATCRACCSMPLPIVRAIRLSASFGSTFEFSKKL
jgi:hypothetical protein